MATTIRTTITMNEELYRELVDISSKENRSISQQIVYLTKKGKELQLSDKRER